eukprot:CAMPEP_0174250988 /NCGR_PEP_ID=MMETSP0439-20130205/968_1 /TAXON_ID=0 /ORGANISM="Stereomyxa ramosa, Strain Chinc5" /LENGTH=530 /DNA_ID=CAMNT_0015331191 /DNA_START=42 /DNA_END=1631 /DNA_ORIENTATION=-
MKQQKNSSLPLSVKALKKVNAGLVPFYKQEISRKQQGYEPMDKDVSVTIGNTFEKQGSNTYKWTAFVSVNNSEDEDLIDNVEFQLHSTFNPSKVVIRSSPFQISLSGWGTFTIGIVVTDSFGNKHKLSHDLSFDDPDNAHEETITVKQQDRMDTERDDLPRMDSSVSEAEMHGHIGVGKGWAPPLLVTYCEEEARPGYRTMQAHEYNDDPETLRMKVRQMAKLIKKSKHCLAYTGAGISTSSGINDYASKSDESRATGTGAAGKRPAQKRGLDAEPTLAHFVLGALNKEGYLKHWVQQNHDGLPQKAGFPQHALNEIHGAWFDPSNPVVPMDGSLRGDLFKWMAKEENKTDLCLTMGTSLCGMNADRMVKTPSVKYIKQGKGLGSVIIGFQRTQMDKYATLRIFASIDEVMLLLALEMNLPVSTKPYKPDIPESARVGRKKHTFIVPYDNAGNLSQKETTVWDLTPGKKIKLTAGPGKGFEGEMTRTPDSEEGRYCSYTCSFPSTREGPTLGWGKHYYALGTWFVEAACK